MADDSMSPRAEDGAWRLAQSAWDGSERAFVLKNQRRWARLSGDADASIAARDVEEREQAAYIKTFMEEAGFHAPEKVEE